MYYYFDSKEDLLYQILEETISAGLSIIQEIERSQKSLIKILDDLQADGEIVDLDTKACAFAFFGMVSWAYRWYDPKGTISPDPLSEIFHRIFTKGIYVDL